MRLTWRLIKLLTASALFSCASAESAILSDQPTLIDGLAELRRSPTGLGILNQFAQRDVVVRFAELEETFAMRLHQFLGREIAGTVIGGQVVLAKDLQGEPRKIVASVIGHELVHVLQNATRGTCENELSAYTYQLIILFELKFKPGPRQAQWIHQYMAKWKEGQRVFEDYFRLTYPACNQGPPPRPF